MGRFNFNKVSLALLVLGLITLTACEDPDQGRHSHVAQAARGYALAWRWP